MSSNRFPITPGQPQLGFTIVRSAEIEGIEMGVMADGTAYLSGRGLAYIVGVSNSVIVDITSDFRSGTDTPRNRAISNILEDQNYSGPLCIPITVGGTVNYAYPATVCSAIIEYYAFEKKRDTALQNLRLLQRSGLQAFIYVQVGFDPTNRIPEAWRQFHDRVSLTYNNVPAGYFSVFKEIADMVVSMIQCNVPVGEKTIPDLSVGQTWGRHWRDNEFDSEFGERVSYEHNYPDYFPQSVSNPQQPWAYPDAALPEFRRWMRQVYLPQKFPNYISSQAAKHHLPPSVAMLAIEAVNPTRIEDS